MKISELEKYIVERDIDEQEFCEYIEEIVENLEYDYNLTRKLTDEEIDYEYFDDYIVEFMNSINLDEEFSSDGKESHCCCGHHHIHNHHHREENEDERFQRSMKSVYIMAMYLLREGIHYIDLVQDGMLGLAKANELYRETDKFEKYKMYFIAKEMIKHIKNQLVYRKTAFAQYIEQEKEKEVKLRLSPRVRLKDRDEEVKRMEAEKRTEHKKEVDRLEEITKNMFDYFKLKYRLSLREIEVISLYFGFDGNGKKNLTDIQNKIGFSLSEVEKLLREGIFKLSVVDEKVEI